jgi:Zn-dependent peptidase ImmA (M78 family)
MLTISYIKPAYHYDSLATQRNTTEANPFAQKLLLKTPKEYTEQYQHAKIVQPYYNFSEQFVSLYNHDWILVVGIMLLIFMTYVKYNFRKSLNDFLLR